MIFKSTIFHPSTQSYSCFFNALGSGTMLNLIKVKIVNVWFHVIQEPAQKLCGIFYMFTNTTYSSSSFVSSFCSSSATFFLNISTSSSIFKIISGNFTQKQLFKLDITQLDSTRFMQNPTTPNAATQQLDYIQCSKLRSSSPQMSSLPACIIPVSCFQKPVCVSAAWEKCRRNKPGQNNGNTK